MLEVDCRIIPCMQDTFARARTRPLGQARDERVSCIQDYRQSGFLIYNCFCSTIVFCFASIKSLRLVYKFICRMMINHSTLEYHVTNFNTFFRWLWRKNQNPNTLL